MSKYSIRYDGTTGDSFGSSEMSGNLEVTWDNLEIVKENLRRIRDHYEFYNKQNSHYWQVSKDQIAQERVEAAGRPWFVDCVHHFYHSVKLLADNGKEFVYHAPWCGYFESLGSIKMVLTEPNEADGTAYSF